MSPEAIEHLTVYFKKAELPTSLELPGMRICSVKDYVEVNLI